MSIRQSQTPEGVLRLTLDAPERRNALSKEMIQQLQEALLHAADDPATKVVVVGARGTVFCAGGDTDRMGGARPSPWEKKEYLDQGVGRLARILWALDKPVIAAVNGPAVGAGMDLALWADYRVGLRSAYLRAGYIDMALPPGFGAAWLLPQLVGQSTALDILLTSRKVDADEALALGLFNQLADSEEDLERRVGEYAALLASKPAPTVRLTKRLVRQARSAHPIDSLETASSHFGVLQETPEHAEAVERFKQSRNRTSG